MKSHLDMLLQIYPVLQLQMFNVNFQAMLSERRHPVHPASFNTIFVQEFILIKKTNKHIKMINTAKIISISVYNCHI